MTPFPLNDNLSDARRARSEGYAGTLNDGRLTWFQPSRRLTVPAALLGGLATLTALSALAAPMVAIDADSYRDDARQLIAQALGREYSLVWLVAGAVALAALLSTLGGSRWGGPARARSGRLMPIIAAAVFGGLAVALAAYLLTHSLDLALRAHDYPDGVRILLPLGWRSPTSFDEPWPFLESPGLGAWFCLLAGILCLVSTALAAINAMVTTPRRASYRPGLPRIGDTPAR